MGDKQQVFLSDAKVVVEYAINTPAAVAQHLRKRRYGAVLKFSESTKVAEAKRNVNRRYAPVSRILAAEKRDVNRMFDDSGGPQIATWRP